MSTRVLGATGEQAAVTFLESRGWTVVARNFRTREGELDVVAQRNDLVAFIEVKTRRSRRFGRPAEAVTLIKQDRIRTLARRWLNQSGLHARVLRFDVIEVDERDGRMSIRHLEGAF
jgi:putative endonuclease